MSADPCDALYARYPAILTDTPTDTRRVGIEHGAGWLSILDATCETLSLNAATLGRRPPKALQIKEKLGSLRIYMAGDDPHDDLAIRLAEQFSNRVCETCGAPGRPHRSDGGWLFTACTNHATEHQGQPQDLTRWERPRIPPLGFTAAELCVRHVDLLAPDAIVDVPPGWLDLADAALDLLGQCSTDRAAGGVGPRVVANTPSAVTIEIGGSVAQTARSEAHRMRHIGSDGQRLVIDIAHSGDEAYAIAACAAALSRRIDPDTGAVRLLEGPASP